MFNNFYYCMKLELFYFIDIVGPNHNLLYDWYECIYVLGKSIYNALYDLCTGDRSSEDKVVPL